MGVGPTAAKKTKNERFPILRTPPQLAHVEPRFRFDSIETIEIMSDIPSFPKNGQLNALFFVFGLVVACFAAVVPFLVMPQFRATSAVMGFDLWWLTRIMQTWYPMFLLLPMLVLAAWWLWPKTSQRGVACLVIGVVGSVLLTSLLMVALQYQIVDAVRSNLGGMI